MKNPTGNRLTFRKTKNPGIDKIGPKTADKLLPIEHTEKQRQDTVVQKYKDQYGRWHTAVITMTQVS